MTVSGKPGSGTPGNHMKKAKLQYILLISNNLKAKCKKLCEGFFNHKGPKGFHKGHKGQFLTSQNLKSPKSAPEER
jgi:hypothetical protein